MASSMAAVDDSCGPPWTMTQRSMPIWRCSAKSCRGEENAARGPSPKTWQCASHAPGGGVKRGFFGMATGSGMSECRELLAQGVGAGVGGAAAAHHGGAGALAAVIGGGPAVARVDDAALDGNAAEQALGDRETVD